VWDIRYRDRSRQRRRGSDAGAAKPEPGFLQSNLIPGAAAAEVPAPPPDLPWAPHYRVTVRAGAGPVCMSAVVFNDRRPSDPLLVGTEEGRFMVIDWAAAGEGTGQDPWLNAPDLAAAAGAAQGSAGDGSTSGRDGSAKGAGAAAAGSAADASGDGEGGGSGSGAAGAGAGGNVMRLLWATQGGERAFVAMQRHPSLHDVILTVNDFTFSVWRRGVRQPVFVSAAAAVPLTSGRWSPTRPAVVFLGRVDGVIECWDLLDSTTKPAMAFPLMSVPVTAMEFRLTGSGAGAAGAAASAATRGAYASSGATAAALSAATSAGAAHKQYLAVGDAKGSLHVLDIPLPLRKGSPNEEALLAAFLDRELARVAYVAGRAAFHEAERARKEGESQREAAAKEAAQAKLEVELQCECGRQGRRRQGRGVAVAVLMVPRASAYCFIEGC
jgi:hypothetical protein